MIIKKAARRVFLLVPLTVILCFAAGCGETREDLNNAYSIYDTTADYLPHEASVQGEGVDLFAADLCVGGLEDSNDSPDSSGLAAAEAVFVLDDQEVTYSKNIYQKLYPASTTKILTAYLALKYGDLDQEVTVSESAINSLEYGSSLCGLQVGDTYTLRDLLYGLLLESGNDAANVIAETVGGSIENFVDMMNTEAATLGATRSHFVNPHGMPNDDHYTTAYDLYLIFSEAIKNEEFVTIISTDVYTVTYLNPEGQEWQMVWGNTNGYLTGEYVQPDGVRVVGGKTGTTDAAGYCLVLYSTNSAGSPVISIVMKSDSHADLYWCMSDLLSNFAN